MSGIRRTTPPGVQARDLVELLRQRGEENGRRAAFTFLADGVKVSERLSYADLDRRARAIASQLLTLGEPGDRVLMLYPSGPEFATAFYGCFYAGMTAVPAYPPRSDKHAARLNAVAQDCGASIIAAPGRLCDTLADKYDPDARWAPTDRVPLEAADDWRHPDITPDDLAFLQYTSGSTGNPKGVMLSHANLLHNLELMARAMGHSENPVYVSWLPLFHDMGLIGHLLQALYWGSELVYMPPEAFLQEPVRWLRALSDHRGTFSAAPNFAFELCVRRTRPEDRAGLDLSHWRLALNAAEPVRADTLARFEAMYAEHGFRPESWHPAYGLAENSVYVSSGLPDSGAVIVHVDGAELEHDRVVEVAPGTAGSRALVGAGHARHGQRTAIVDPATRRALDAHRVGEIWISGPSAGQGYWGRTAETAATFGNRLAGEEESTWVATGDKGFLTPDGELVITGRIKDMIIVRGRNLYPQDIERTVETVDRSFRPGCTAAFSVESESGEERVVVVQEVRGEDADAERIGPAVAAAVVAEHDVPLHALVLLRTRAIPKTSSGKLARRAARKGYLEGTLDALATWTAPGTAPRPGTEGDGPGADGDQDQNALVRRILDAIAEHTGLAVDELDPTANFHTYGVDSASAVAISGALQRELGRRVPAALLYQHPTAEAAARHLAARSTGHEADAQTAPRTGTPAAPDAAEPIAVVGMACRFPGAENTDEFWTLLHGGGDAITPVPADRWDAESLYDPELKRDGTASTRWGGFLGDVAGFEPEFFGISPAEAVAIDPQQRLLMEVVWEALENAAIVPADLAGSDTGVFVGISNNDYSRLTAGAKGALGAYYGTGNALSVAANRLSYLLDLRGPSLALDAACSSSLVAVHQACEALRRGESSLAVAAGVNLLLAPDLTAVFSRAQMMASDGRCKAFDERADGYVRSEGCGAVILKPLSLALADGDRVLAVVRGSAVNQDGRSNGLTAPHGRAQTEVLRTAWSAAGIAPRELGYIEAHGTGTALGDPIEYEALTEALSTEPAAEGDAAGPCYLGSVKTNIGHLESAAGIAGFIKVVLALQHGTVPPHLHLTRLNPHIDAAGSPLEIPTAPLPWPEDRRTAGVSAFGFGGTNAHVVLSAAPTPAAAPAAEEARRPEALLLSARTPEALRDLAARYADRLARTGSGPGELADIAWTSSQGRTALPERLAVTADSAEEARAALERFAAEGRPPAAAARGRAPRKAPVLAFLFTGQGSHRVGMGTELHRDWPVFREAFDRCAALLKERFGFDLHHVVRDEEALARTEYAQPAIFATEYALARLWRSLGVEPDYLAGHSVGEFVAATLAGVFAVEDALTLLGTRARLMQGLPPGGVMYAVRVSEERALAALAPYADEVALAAVNGPGEVVLSGAAPAVAKAVDELAQTGVVAQQIRTSHAFHSPLMDPVLEEFRAAAEGVRMRAPQHPVVSSLTGQLIGRRMATPDYWVEQLRGTVRYADTIATLSHEGCTAGIEVGPDAVLAPLARRATRRESAKRQGQPGSVWLASLRSGRPEQRALLDALGAAWAAGVAVDWARVHSGRPTALPGYPFQRRRFWLPDTLEAAPADGAALAGESGRHPLLGRRMEGVAADPGRHAWQRSLARDQVAVLDDHVIQGRVVAPGTSYIDMALAAARELAPGVPYRLQDVAYHSVLSIPPDGARIVQVGLRDGSDGALAFTVHSKAEGDTATKWTQHASARLVPVRHAGNGQHGESAANGESAKSADNAENADNAKSAENGESAS
ncbi:beta-ketoacyl synthase N-terminal-like domain-containing protein [Streptomyces sp. NPDC006251]|uniref:beta-ketoacyl synthase N-terminal-like domain-containing protein n=1 Tax=Streptomyces sp. NPDC006251 TaxID=3155718 RepID=UPI0033B886BC